MPLLPIASKLKNLSPQTRIIGVLDKSAKFADIIANSPDFDTVLSIDAGKYRRYPNQSTLEKMTDLSTHSKNIQDGFKTLKGFSQAVRLLSSHKPDVIFFKGGYVSVPLGLAARVKKIPYIVHDSDATLSLTGKIIGRWAKYHMFGIGIPEGMRQSDRLIHVGVPVSDAFRRTSATRQSEYKQAIGVSDSKPLVLVVGGSQGAEQLNKIVIKNIEQLTANNINVLHQTGKGRASTAKTEYYQQIEFITDLATYSGAADVVVTRAGSGIAEFSAQEKAIIVVPAEQLAGGHQMQNAQILSDKEAAEVLHERKLQLNPGLLTDRIVGLLNDSKQRLSLAQNLSRVYPKDASLRIAKLLLKQNYENN